MTEQSQPYSSLQDVRDIRQMMERSSRFISLSGLSGISAGIFALAGAAIARYYFFEKYYVRYSDRDSFSITDFRALRTNLILLAGVVLFAAFVSAFYFTWKKSYKNGQPVWNIASRRLSWNMAIPILTGAFFILGMLQFDDWRFVAPASLVFYGLALVNASKYTLSDIRYLGYCEIIIGLINMRFIGYGLYFWALGFGVMHIIYGLSMWWKYERKNSQAY